MQILSLLFILGLYYLTKYSGVGLEFFHPLTLFVTFLHEFGHGFFSLITGGSVSSLDVNFNGSGLATTSGGIRSLTIMGGYIGSAIFGALLLFTSVRFQEYTKYTLRFLSILLFFSSIFWFSDIVSSLIQIVLGGILFGLSYLKSTYSSFFLQLVGVFSLLHIIQDFNVGPSSDLANFSGLLPVIVWQYIWLIIVISIFLVSIKYTYFSKKKVEEPYKIIFKK